MNNTFLKLTKKINYEIKGDFKNVSITNVKLEDKKIFNIQFQSNEIIKAHLMEEFLSKLNQNFDHPTKISFSIETIIYDVDNIKEYILMILKKIFNQKHLVENFNLFNFVIKKDHLIIKVSDSILNTKMQNVLEKLNNALKKFGFKNLLISLEFVDIDDSILSIHKEELQNQVNQMARRQASIDKEPISSFSYKTKGYERAKISLLSELGLKNVLVSGEIFKIEGKETKTGMIVSTISITDFEDAIYIKTFSKTAKEKEVLDTYEIGQFIEVKGSYQIDSYSKEPVIFANHITVSKKMQNIREDNLSEKRVELSVRTKISTMDGIQTPANFLNKAKEWGHKAIAILDEDSAQAYPDFFNASKNLNVKPIYGTSLNTISPKTGSVTNEKDVNLKDDTYIVFDLETTGLSPEYEDIIEFGATKIVNNAIVDRKQFFIKPTKPISKFITEITGITDEKVKDAKPESDAILDIKKYFGDHTLIAHNSNFDMTFVNTKLEKYGYKVLNNPIIDTLVVSKIILHWAKRFSLGYVSRKIGVDYDPDVAHRADYDAEVLAKVWLKMLPELFDKYNIITQKDLAKYNNDTIKSKKFAKEVSLLVKNQDGLKELFNFLSLALTKDFINTPKININLLNERKNILLGSGALKSVLVDKMLFSSKKEVIKEIARYDYIEIQPLRNYVHVINRGFEKKDLIDMIKFVIQESKKQNKIVVATGDVRYIDEKEKLYHEVYINAKGLGGKRHYLYKFKEENPIYPTQNLLTTQEMIQEFAFLNNINLIKEIVVTNTNLIADMIDDNIEVIKKDLYTPKFGDSDIHLTELVYKNARKIYGDRLPEIIKTRIEKELSSIIKHGFAVIYWISHKLVAKSLKDGYLVGSRGSVGSSIVATFAEITEVNPLAPHYICSDCKYSEFNDKYNKLNSGYDLSNKSCPKCNNQLSKEGQNIPFETFLGFKADKIPDIDLNFSGDYQSTIHAEVKKLFGEKHAFRAGTISTVAEKTAFGYVKAWAEDKNKSISKAFVEFIVKGVAGTKRTTGQHPGGIIVIPSEFSVEDFTPVNYPANDGSSLWKTTHFDFHAIHDNVLKLDLLGHDDPTAIKTLEELTGVNAKKDIPFNDTRVISLFSSTKELGITPDDICGETTGAMGIPEFGTNFVRRMLKNAEVKSFGDLISLSGLSHGTNVWTGNVEEIIKTKGLKLNDVISCRDNIMIDLMNKGLNPSLSFTIMEKVRKGKGVSQEEEISMKAIGVEDWYIDSLKKIKYMFPKAHATAYVMMAWRIAWFKLYHPLAYYATYFTTRSDVFDIESIINGKESVINKLKDYKERLFVKYGDNKLSNKEQALIPIYEIVLESMARGIKILNIDLNKSKVTNWYYEKDTNALIPPFIAIDGLGASVANKIVLAREEKKFTSVEDLSKRSSLNKTLIEVFDNLGITKHLSKTNQISLF